MDQESVREQIKSIADSLRQMAAVQLSLTVSADAQHRATLLQLNESRRDLIGTLIDLNRILEIYTAGCYRFKNRRHFDLNKGNFVLAPKFVSGQLCYDFAVVIDVLSEQVNSNPYVSGKYLDEKRKECSGAEAGNPYGQSQATQAAREEQIVKILWVRPLTLHEHYSKGINFSASQLADGSAIEEWDRQIKALQCLTAGNAVQVLLSYAKTGRTTRDGLWVAADVVSISKDKGTCVVAVNESEVNQSIGSAEMEVALQPSHIAACISKPESDKSAHETAAGSDETVDSDGDKDVHDGITAIASYHQQHVAKQIEAQATADSMATQGKTKRLGEWEEHTRGTKLLIFTVLPFIYQTIGPYTDMASSI